ncbi:MAG TPA: septal ring lytic transglycosylase RlpA family protein [Thermoanaerobaculia bacterium]|nr:septal ring lytic transglycosylase RlpA family protein [Thermoanaerobaculia bacterium]
MRPTGALRLVLLFAVLAPAVACASRAPASRPSSAQIPPGRGWTEEGLASWYGGKDGFEGKPTASGEIYDSSLLTAAHRELPLGTVVDVTNLDNGKTVRVRINDRGPFIAGRVIDLSRAAAREIDLIGPGVGPVRIGVVLPGPVQDLVSPSGRWAVQVGSFADRLRAERHAERVRGTGRTVFLEPVRGLSRVKVGPFASRVEAERELAALENDGYEGIVVPTD